MAQDVLLRHRVVVVLAIDQQPLHAEGVAERLGARPHPAEPVIGSRAFVCDNVAFCGEMVLARRLTP